MKDHIARWLGYHHELAQLRSRCALLEEQRHGARTRSTRNLARAAAGERRAAAATSLLAEARRERDQWERTAAACEQTLADMSADDRRAEALILRARHTININPKGAQAHLDQAVRILRGEA